MDPLVPSQAACGPLAEPALMASLCLREVEILHRGYARRGCPAPGLASSAPVLQAKTELDGARGGRVPEHQLRRGAVCRREGDGFPGTACPAAISRAVFQFPLCRWGAGGCQWAGTCCRFLGQSWLSVLRV